MASILTSRGADTSDASAVGQVFGVDEESKSTDTPLRHRSEIPVRDDDSHVDPQSQISARNAAAGPSFRAGRRRGANRSRLGDGAELFYVDPQGALRAVAVRRGSGGTLVPGVPVQLGAPPIGVGHWGTQYDVTRDGSRVYFLDRDRTILPSRPALLLEQPDATSKRCGIEDLFRLVSLTFVSSNEVPGLRLHASLARAADRSTSTLPRAERRTAVESFGDWQLTTKRVSSADDRFSAPNSLTLL